MVLASPSAVNFNFFKNIWKTVVIEEYYIKHLYFLKKKTLKEEQLTGVDGLVKYFVI